MAVKYTFRQGDSIVNVAYQHGFFAETLWNHPDNAALKAKRKDMNILMPGDVLAIPDKRMKEVTGATTQKHRFRIKGIPAIFRMQVFDVDEPRAGQTYRLTIRGPGFVKELKGVTDERGILQASVPPGSTQGDLFVGDDELHILVKLGHLDPINEPSGIQKRLLNLGFDCGEADGEIGPATRKALLAFQRRFGLPETGEPDAATTKKLEIMNEEVSDFPDKPPDKVE